MSTQTEKPRIILAPAEESSACAPAGQTFPFGWCAAPITGDRPLKLSPPEFDIGSGPVRLRLTVALEIQDQRRLTLSSSSNGVHTSPNLAASNSPGQACEADAALGLPAKNASCPEWAASQNKFSSGSDPATPSVEMSICYACVFQPFEVELPDALVRSAAIHGVDLRLSGGSEPVWVFLPQPTSGAPDDFLPRLLPAAEPSGLPGFLDAFVSDASLQPFNWIEGCVLDGLYDLQEQGLHGAANDVLKRHLGRYFLDDGRLVYVGPHSELRENNLFGIEAMLPFAALAKTWPGHKAAEILIGHVRKHADADGLVSDRGFDAQGIPVGFDTISIEGCYTVAYPLAVYARVFGLEEYAKLALLQLRHRQEELLLDVVVNQRRNRSLPYAEQGNWARAWCWYFLGTARTLAELGENYPGTGHIREAFVLAAGYVRSLQQPDGLWSVYLDEPATGTDTSGSAGISAGFAWGVRIGLLPAEYLETAQRTLEGLTAKLTPEGFLGGVAQLNRGGEDLQRNGYRVIGQFAMGLMAQLYAALR